VKRQILSTHRTTCSTRQTKNSQSLKATARYWPSLVLCARHPRSRLVRWPVPFAPTVSARRTRTQPLARHGAMKWPSELHNASEIWLVFESGQVAVSNSNKKGPDHRASTAGSVTRYSNYSLEHLSAALSRFATPHPDEKSLEQLEALFQKIATSPRKQAKSAPRIHDAARRLGPERVRELVAKYEAGSPAQSLAVEFEVGISTVLRILRSQGGAVRGHGVSEEIRNEACRLYESGLSVQKVPDRLELT
jgi:hypothetical protein